MSLDLLNLRSSVPEGACGNWSVERFTVTADDERSQRLYACNPSSRGRYVPAGSYTALKRGKEVIMSDTPNELEDLLEFSWFASGHTLINGLGLGMAVEIAMQSAKRVTVVEVSGEVISLVANHLLGKYGDRLEIVCADAYEFKPPRGARYDAVWHDIWDNICADNLDGMRKLHRKYGRRCDWQGSWAKEYLT